jgi:hypothetical protein
LFCPPCGVMTGAAVLNGVSQTGSVIIAGPAGRGLGSHTHHRANSLRAVLKDLGIWDKMWPVLFTGLSAVGRAFGLLSDP